MKTLKKALNFEREIKNAQKTAFLKPLESYLTYLPIALFSKTALHSKPLMIALTASMEGIIKNNNNELGLYSPDLEKLTQLIAQGLIATSSTTDEPLMQQRLLSKMLLGSFTTLIGLLYLAYDQTLFGPSPEEIKHKDTLYIELLVRAFFSSELPKNTLDTLTQAAGLSGDLPSRALETLALLLVLLSFSRESGEYDLELLDGIKDRLHQNLTAIDLYLSDLVTTNKISQATAQPARLFTAQAKQTLSSRNFDLFLKGLSDLLKPYNLSLSALQQDLQTARRLFAALGTNVEVSSHAKDNVVTFSG